MGSPPPPHGFPSPPHGFPSPSPPPPSMGFSFPPPPSLPPPPNRTCCPILHMKFVYICPYGHWAYGLYTEHPGPIIRNGMGPVIEYSLMVACVTTMLLVCICVCDFH